MKLRLAALLILTGLLGCSQVQEPSLYDTAGNPSGFPRMAVELVVNLENDELIGGEAITNAFGDLYTQHSELLDNEEWRAVVELLGGRFGVMADSLKDLGLGSYTLAAEYYQLGSFARPEDSRLRRQAALFGTWLSGHQDTAAHMAVLTRNDPPALSEIMPAVRYFMRPSTMHQEFLKTYLSPAIRAWDGKSGLLSDEAVDQLSSHDRALLISAGILDK